MELHRDLLQVEDDVGRILDDARDRRELVEHAVDLHGRDGRAFDRREQHAPQRVADRGAETALEGLRVEPAEPVRQSFALNFEPLGTLKTSSRASSIPFAYGPAARPPDLPVMAAGLPPQV